MLSTFRKYRDNKSGAVTAETAYVMMFMILFTGAAVEGSFAFWQWSGAQQAARVGARVAAITNPVATDLHTMTGMSNGTQAGDPMPAYSRTCTAGTASCDQGAYDSIAMNKIIYGLNNDGTCAKTTRLNRGMCDVFGGIKPANVTVKYEGSGLGKTGNPAQLSPLVTVTVTNINYNFLFLDLFTLQNIVKMPDVRVTVMAEDLRSGV